MKSYKFFCILSVFIFCSVSNSLFSMQNKKLEVCELFKELENEKVNLKHKGCKAISPYHKYVVSEGKDKKVIVWDIFENEEKCSYIDDGWVNCVSFSLCGKYVVSGKYDGEVIVRDIFENKEKFSYTHNEGVQCIIFSPDGDSFISIDKNGQVKIFKTSCEFSLDQQCYELNKKAKNKIKKGLVKQKNKKHRCDVAIVCDSL